MPRGKKFTVEQIIGKLREAQVRLLADRIGLPSDLRVVATYGGKHRGEAWSRFQRGEFEINTGDNLHADVHVPRRHRVQTQHFDGGVWTPAGHGPPPPRRGP